MLKGVWSPRISKVAINKMNLSALSKNHLNEFDAPETPSVILKQWLQDAQQSDIPLPMVASLASASLPSGRVSNRMVNVKELNSDGNLVLYSDFSGSRKGQDIASNSHVAVTFYWQKLDRSVRVEGKVKLLSKEQSRPYFESRSKDFQASVLLGGQSHPVPDGRQPLVDKLNQLMSSDSQLKIPEYWTGAEIFADWIEFWQGSPDRISDRLVYSLDSEKWSRQRVSP